MSSALTISVVGEEQERAKKVVPIRGRSTREVSEPLKFLEDRAAERSFFSDLVWPVAKPVTPDEQIFSGDIWGRHYPRRRLSWVSSTVFCCVLAFTIASIQLTLGRPRIVEDYETAIMLINPVDEAKLIFPRFKPEKKAVKGGGGGGRKSTTPASKGSLPRFSTEQVLPPTTRIPEVPVALPVAPTLIAKMEIPALNLTALLGDPLSNLKPPSDGPGGTAGIGSGEGSGIGRGSGAGAGSGSGGGQGGGRMRSNHGIISPVPISQVSARYTTQAFAEGIQGTVLLEVVIGIDGGVRIVKVVTGLGWGLDEEAIKAVEQWKYQPARNIAGSPVAITARVPVYFRK